MPGIAPRSWLRRRGRKPSWLTAAVFLAVLLALFVRGRQQPPPVPISPAKELAGTAAPAAAGKQLVAVTRVVDGDTMVVEGLGKVRLIGIDTPERGMPYYRQAAAFARKMVGGRKVRLEICPVKPRDRYGRLRAVVYLENGTNLNTELLRQGYALVYTLMPCHVDSGKWVHFVREARAAGRGLWAEKPEISPEEDRGWRGVTAPRWTMPESR